MFFRNVIVGKLWSFHLQSLLFHVSLPLFLLYFVLYWIGFVVETLVTFVWWISISVTSSSECLIRCSISCALWLFGSISLNETLQWSVLSLFILFHLSSHWDCINDICVDISKSSSRLISIFSSFCFFSNHSFRCSFRFLNRADSFGLSNPFDFLSNVDLIQPFVQWSWMLCFPCSFCSKTTSSHSSPGISMWNFTVSPSGWYRRIKSFRHHLCHPISSFFLCSFISNEWRCSSIYSSSSDVTVRHFLFSILFRICCVIHIVSILCHINNRNKKMLFMKRNSTERKWENEDSWWWWWNSLCNDSELNKEVFVTVFLWVFDWRWCMSQPVAIYHDEWCCMKLVISDEKRITHSVSWVKTKWKRELHMRLLFRLFKSTSSTAEHSIFAPKIGTIFYCFNAILDFWSCFVFDHPIKKFRKITVYIYLFNSYFALRLCI